MPLKLYAFEKPFNVPSLSGFCQKSETYLRAVGYTDYTSIAALPFTAPKGKLPFIILDDKDTVADSHFIIRHLIRTGTTRDLDEGLSPAQRADSRAWQAYIEELVYPAMLWQRCSDPQNVVELNRETFDNLPWLLRYPISLYMGWHIRRSLVAHGVGRHSVEEITEIVEEYIVNLEARLAPTDGSMFFFHGEAPTLADVVSYAFMVNALGTKSNPVVRNKLLASGRLCRYIALLTERWFPEYEGILRDVK